MPVNRPLLDQVLNQPAKVQPPSCLDWGVNHLNIIVPSLARGGAERSVLDVARGLSRSGGTGVLYVLNHLAVEYAVSDDSAFPVVSLAGMNPVDQMKAIATQVLSSPTPVVISHLIRTAQLRTLWQLGVQTIPVIQNSAMGWHEPVSNFDDPHVPFMIAVSNEVKVQLLAAGCGKPVSVIRHELQRWKTEEQHRADRAEIRSRFGVNADTTLVGMVGQFRAQKSYVRAVRVLAALKSSRDVKLMIVGGWDHKWGSAGHAHAATVEQARELGVLDDIIFVGAVSDGMKYMSAFDVFLNTSIYEGLSVATLEAAHLGCPLVLSDVGGQREIASHSSCQLMSDPSDIPAYVRAIEAVATHEVRGPSLPPKSRYFIPQLWSLIAEQAVPSPHHSAVQTLFVTSNLNPGGAQRSLTNLLLAISADHPSWLCVVDRVLADEFIDALRSTTVGLGSPSATGNLVSKAHEILLLAKRLGVTNLVFWNLDAALKLILAKALECNTMTLIDVSPGPMLFDELESIKALQQRLAFTTADYLGRLDHFVAKYNGGLPPDRISGRPKRVHVIPNGVPVPPERGAAPPLIRPPDMDARYALVTCCRIAPNKCLETLVEVMALLNARLPAASLTIVGGLDQRHVGYFERIAALVTERGVSNLFFVGPHGRVFDFLDQFRVFIMLSKSQGCPNASLEAMAMSLPVIANPDGGTAEQVLHGRTGFLVRVEEPGEIAAHAARLLIDEDLARTMGEAGRDHVLREFSLGKMASAYRLLLESRSPR